MYNIINIIRYEKQIVIVIRKKKNTKLLSFFFFILTFLSESVVDALFDRFTNVNRCKLANRL